MALDPSRRRRARRRLAAIAFLSDISLEGPDFRLDHDPVTKREPIQSTSETKFRSRNKQTSRRVAKGSDGAATKKKSPFIAG